MIGSSCAFTGHRPARFSFGYDESDERCLKIKALMSERIGALIANGVTRFYSGMALGVDQWAAKIILDMKKMQTPIRLIAVLPCETQADNWPEEHRERYFNMLSQCDRVMTLRSRYTQSCMFERDRYLVDHADYLLAVYNGNSIGGTAYTLQYAKQKGRKVIIIHPDTLAVTSL